MRREPLTRRMILSAGAAALALSLPLCLPSGSARAQALAAQADQQLRFSGIVVDIAPLQRVGGGGVGAALQPVLKAELAKIFADRLSPGDPHAPVLVARISSLTFVAYAGGYAIDDLGPNDSIEGDGLVVSGRRELSSTHILTSLSPTYSGAYYTEGIDRVRLQSIAYQFAYWLRREMNI